MTQEGEYYADRRDEVGRQDDPSSTFVPPAPPPPPPPLWAGAGGDVNICLPPTRTLAALLAMQGILANANLFRESNAMRTRAVMAVDHADALLKRLKETEPKT